MGLNNSESELLLISLLVIEGYVHWTDLWESG